MSKKIYKNTGGITMNATVERYIPIKKSLKDSCEEVKLMRNGKLPKKSWKDFVNKLYDEKDD